jgi:uncharacterized repeat protein (TIGR01451 family)
MRRWLPILVLFAGCKVPPKPASDPAFPTLPTNTSPTPSWSNNDAPEPNWASSPTSNPGPSAPQTGDVFRIAPPERAFDGSVKLLVPEGIAPGQEMPVRIDWRAEQPAVVRHSIPDGVQLMRSDPPARLVGRHLEWTVPVGGGSVFALYQPARVGRFDLESEITGGNGTPIQSRATTTIGVVQMRLGVVGPATASIGDAINFEARVTNSGQVPAQHAVLRADLDTGLEHATGSRRVEIPVGPISPGETRTLVVPVVIKRSGSLAAALSLQSESGATANESLHVDVREARLAVSLDGPARVMMNQSATWTLRVVNTGDAPAKNVNARVQLPPELKLDAKSKSAWPIGTLGPREESTLQVLATVIAPVGRTSVVASAIGDRVPEARSDVTLEAVGVPMLKMTLRGGESIVEVGRSVVYTIEVKNTGSLPLRNIEIAADLPANLTAKHGVGPTMANMDGPHITFARVAQLDSNRTIIFRVEAEAAQPGDARITVEARSESLPTPVRQDEATRVVAK